MADENKYNIKIEAGTDFVLPFLWEENDNPIDLTGSTVTAQLREYSGSPDVFEFICTHNGAGGRITLTMPHEVTAQIPFSNGVYDVQVALDSGIVKRPLYGEVKVQDEVTKPLDGEMLYTIAIESYNKLPVQGLTNRLYYVYAEQMILRWNGTNYVSALGELTVPGEHDSERDYPRQSIVSANGLSYISKTYVPEGVDVDNETYWMPLLDGSYAQEAHEAALEAFAAAAEARSLIDDDAGEGDTNKVWSADKVDDLLYKDITSNRYSEASNCNLAIFKCAKTWVDNYDEHIHYWNDGNPNSVNRVNGVNSMVTDIKPGTVVDGKYPLDCMSFVMMCLMGIGYEESIFGDKSNVAKYPRADIPFLSDEFMKWAYYRNSNELPFDYTLPDNFTWQRVLSWQFAAYLASKGLYHEVESDYKLAALQPGDICFFVNSGEPTAHFKNIGHVSIYVGPGRFGNIVVLENGHISQKSRNSFLEILTGYARIPLTETVLPHNIMKSHFLNYIGKDTSSLAIDRPVNANDIYLIRYAFRFTSNSDIGNMMPAFGAYYGNTNNDITSFIFSRLTETIASEKFSVTKLVEDEMVLVLDKTLFDISNYPIKYLMMRVYRINGNTGDAEITVKEIIPVMTKAEESITVPYIDPITTDSLNTAVSILAWKFASMHATQVVKSFVWITINGNAEKYYVRCNYLATSGSYEIILLKEDLTGMKYSYVGGVRTTVTYDENNKATFDLLASILPNNP